MMQSGRVAATVFALALWASAGAAQTLGDVEAGASVYRQCAACHQIGEDANNRVGPHLNDLFGRHVGGLEDFRYSNALTKAGQDGLIWDAETLDAFIADPRGYLSGTRMSYRGLDDPQDRADLLAYLASFSTEAAAEAPAAAPAFAVSDEILAIVGDPAYGEYLSGECTSCHVESGADGIPTITGYPAPAFVTLMHAYKEGAREHPVMQMMAGRLTDEEIAALAAYFEGIE